MARVAAPAMYSSGEHTFGVLLSSAFTAAAAVFINRYASAEREERRKFMKRQRRDDAMT